MGECNINRKGRLLIIIGLAVALVNPLLLILGLARPNIGWGVNSQVLFFIGDILFTLGIAVVLVGAVLSKAFEGDRKSPLLVNVGLVLALTSSLIRMLYWSHLFRFRIWPFYLRDSLLAAGIVIVLVGVILSKGTNSKSRLLVIVGLAVAFVFPFLLLLEIEARTIAFWLFYTACGSLAVGIALILVGVILSKSEAVMINHPMLSPTP